MISYSDILILIVTHNGSKTIQKTLQSVCSNFQDKTTSVLVIDNASLDNTVSKILSLYPRHIEVKKMNKNIGIARAYNIGLQRATQLGAKWLFILDQDSVCNSNCLSFLINSTIYLIKKGEKVGAISALARNQQFPEKILYPYDWTGTKLKTVSDPNISRSNFLFPIGSAISSGTLYSVEALTSINGFRDQYFIDFVDHECHIRLLNENWSLWWETRAIFYHRLGKIQKMMKNNHLWIEHAPFRYYYITRNMIDCLWRMGGGVALIHFVSELITHICLVRQNSTKFYEIMFYIVKGIKDAILQRFGSLDSTN